MCRTHDAGHTARFQKICAQMRIPALARQHFHFQKLSNQDRYLQMNMRQRSGFIKISISPGCCASVAVYSGGVKFATKTGHMWRQKKNWSYVAPKFYICYVVDLIACARSTFGNDRILSSFFSFILTSSKISPVILMF
jgi:hypothetical protein